MSGTLVRLPSLCASKVPHRPPTKGLDNIRDVLNATLIWRIAARYHIYVGILSCWVKDPDSRRVFGIYFFTSRMPVRQPKQHRRCLPHLHLSETDGNVPGNMRGDNART